MRVRNAGEPLSARRRWPAIFLAVILGGCWAALGLGPSGTARAESGQTDSLAPIPEDKGEEATRSVWDGVYTEEQADRGRKIFRTQCADCHQTGEFKMGYLTVNDIFSSRDSMPEISPGSVSAEAYVDLIAYIFSANGLPSGKEELEADPEILERIRIEPEKPTGP
jgi:mono/diheme cytochrome c family protein